MKRLALGILLALACATCFGANPLPPAVQQAIDKLTADTQAYSLASGSLASPRPRWQRPRISSRHCRPRRQPSRRPSPRIRRPSRRPLPMPSARRAGPGRRTSGADPGDRQQHVRPVQCPGTVLAAQAAGVPVRRIDTDKDPAAKVERRCHTHVHHRGRRRRGDRYKGGLNQKQLVDWYADTRAWVAKKFPTKP